MHLTSSPIDWYAARAGGVVAFLLLTVVVVLGTRLASGARSERWPRFALQDVHRFAGLLTGTFIAVHVVTVAIDAYLPFSLTSILVPFAGSYRTVFLGLGVVAAELLAALAISNGLRRRHRLGYATWRRLHYLNFGVWAAALVHLLGTGTDRSSPWLVALAAGSAFAVLLATAIRVLEVRGARAPARIGAAIAASGVVAAGTAALALGPLAFHPVPWNAATFTDRLDGQILQQPGATRGLVSMAGRGRGRQRVLVRADLLVAPDRLIDTDFQMQYLPSGATCHGRVKRIDADGLGFRARCALADGRSRDIHAHWDAVDGGTVTGGVIESAAHA